MKMTGAFFGLVGSMASLELPAPEIPAHEVSNCLAGNPRTQMFDGIEALDSPGAIKSKVAQAGVANLSNHTAGQHGSKDNIWRQRPTWKAGKAEVLGRCTKGLPKKDTTPATFLCLDMHLLHF